MRGSLGCREAASERILEAVSNESLLRLAKAQATNQRASSGWVAASLAAKAAASDHFWARSSRRSLNSRTPGSPAMAGESSSSSPKASETIPRLA
ncbi:MAG: hypothetical protein EBS49_04560 [Verrucomicrobia bacterium]|nr:hypothetical protein [Verrucomicrobiota bacterium]